MEKTNSVLYCLLKLHWMISVPMSNMMGQLSSQDSEFNESDEDNLTSDEEENGKRKPEQESIGIGLEEHFNSNDSDSSARIQLDKVGFEFNIQQMIDITESIF